MNKKEIAERLFENGFMFGMSPEGKSLFMIIKINLIFIKIKCKLNSANYVADCFNFLSENDREKTQKIANNAFFVKAIKNDRNHADVIDLGEA